MSELPTSTRGAFLRSGQHAWLAALTVGVGFATGTVPGLIAGAAAYAVGWIFLPDSTWFRGVLERREAAAKAVASEAAVAEFTAQRSRLLSSLSAPRRQRYQALAAVCRDIETASAEAQTVTGLPVETRLHKLDELMWTYLRLLAAEQAVEMFLETERRESVDEAAASAETEYDCVAREIAELKAHPSPGPELATKERVLASLRERLEALRQRAARVRQAEANRDLVRAEQERLAEQVKLIRADAVASRNADVLTSRIDASIQHLSSTNQWLGELAEFKDLTATLPETGRRVGYEPTAEPAPRQQAPFQKGDSNR